MGTVTTVGHGTLDADDIVRLLQLAGIDTVVDVRRFPGSRRHPHVARDAMAAWLPAAGIGYAWLPALGGRRTPDPGSPNVALRNPQLRAYADHMASTEFCGGVADLHDLAAEHAVAVLCAESVWWRCHRRLLADHLVLVDATPVLHLFHDGRRTPHPPTPEARVADGVVVYDRSEPVERPTLFDA